MAGSIYCVANINPSSDLDCKPHCATTKVRVPKTTGKYSIKCMSFWNTNAVRTTSSVGCKLEQFMWSNARGAEASALISMVDRVELNSVVDTQGF